MPDKLDYKKTFPDLYQPLTKPGLVEVPPMSFLTVTGRGDPNEAEGAYAKALEVLYALSYTVKMSKMGGKEPQGYFDYVMPPLEGFWWLEDSGSFDFFSNKGRYCWISAIRQPEFVTDAVLTWAQGETQRKKPELDVSKASLIRFKEGLCVQAMHTGPFSREPETLAAMEAFIEAGGLQNDIGAVLPDGLVRRHHEIYLSDPRKAKPDNWKTILRHPVRRKEVQP